MYNDGDSRNLLTKPDACSMMLPVLNNTLPATEVDRGCALRTSEQANRTNGNAPSLVETHYGRDHVVNASELTDIGVEVLTVKQVAYQLGLHPNTVYGMIRDNRFPVRPLPLPRRRYLFSRAAIERFLEVTR